MPGLATKSLPKEFQVAKFRSLAPAGNFPPISSVLPIMRDRLQRRGPEERASVFDTLGMSLASLLSAKQILLTGSGTAALYSLLHALRVQHGARSVGLAEFTCPSIAAAAIRAGLRIIVVPQDPRTLSPCWDKLGELPSIVILSNLYGLADPLPHFETTSRGKPIVIDDACQSLMTKTADGVVGNRGSDFGILSFGRGKAICGVGGGAIVDSRGLLDPNGIIATGSRVLPSIVSGLKYILSTIAEQPELFWIPSSMPILRLGETRYTPDFQLRNLDSAQAIVALAQLTRLQQSQAVFRSNSQRWLSRLQSLSCIQPLQFHPSSAATVPVRFPIILPHKALRKPTLEGLSRWGLSASYAATLFDFPAIEKQLIGTPSDSGRLLATQLITLPVHRFIGEQEIEMVAQRLTVIVESSNYG